MLIAGFQKTSFVDYPGQPCAVVFTPYCNMDCVYCHNAHIIKRDAPLIPEEPVLEYLEKRAGLLTAVVISGGEPTLQQNLEAFILRVKTFGYKVKLDTTGEGFKENDYYPTNGKTTFTSGPSRKPTP